jgi:phosphoglucosamine mutase
LSARRLFGTDGVRGLANGELLTPELAVALSASAARVLAERDRSRRPLAVVGRDPRASGEMLEAAVVAGLTSAGADAVRVGVLPTPAVAFLVGDLGADLGVMISASHNPMPDNGIKLFAAGGHKLPDSVESAVEDGLGAAAERPTGAAIGRVRDLTDAVDRYRDHLLAVTPAPLSGLRVVVDCAHGAASTVAPETYRRAGADVVALHAEPDGLNINDGVGSTHIGPLREAVLAHGADLGIAHDGDADRCLAVDHTGAEVDGDQILAVLALAMREREALRSDTVVATVMSNLGFKLAMEREGIRFVQTGVGDRYVLEEMKEHGYALGGEQSGHVIILDHATTGDGTLTGLMLAARVAQTGRTLRDLASVMERLPQVLVNVPDVDRSRVSTSAELAAAVSEAERELGSTGRVLLRPSGTEPLVRVMVEAADIEQARSVAGRLADSVKSALG